jgi:protein SCO1/2
VSYENPLRAGPFLPSIFNALALAMLIGLQPASGDATGAAQSATPPEAEHGGNAHHHEATPGYQRSLASYSVPGVVMVNQNGQRVSLPELLNSVDTPIMLNFIFTSCTAVCPMMTAIFAKVQTQLGEDAGRVRMVSISIDPEHDTPAELAAYAARFGAQSPWEFLTGSLDDSIKVQQAFDAYRGDKMNHTPVTFFRATPEAQWVRYDGFADAADLVKEYRGMLAD